MCVKAWPPLLLWVIASHRPSHGLPGSLKEGPLEPADPGHTATPEAELAAAPAEGGGQPVRTALLVRPQGGSYGVGVVGGSKTNGLGNFVSKVKPGSPAAAAALEVGDRIVRVDGVDVRSSSFADVMERIHAARDELELAVIFDPAGHDRATTTLLQQQASEPDDGDPAAAAMRVERSATVSAGSRGQAPTQQAEEPPRSVIIAREPGTGLGFSLMGSSREGAKGVHVSRVAPGSPAAIAGLKVGDRVLEINRESMVGRAQPEVRDVLKAVGETVMFRVAYDPAGLEAHQASSLARQRKKASAASAPRSVQLGPAGEGTSLGLRLLGPRAEVTPPLGTFVAVVHPDGVAARAGLIVGDRVLEVAGESVAGCSVDEVQARLEVAATRSVEVVVASSVAELERACAVYYAQQQQQGGEPAPVSRGTRPRG